jgi:hypothetical protein
MTGGSIGMMVGGPIVAAIGAIGGALVGWIGSLFGDHGRSKEVAYDHGTVQPALSKEMMSFEQGGVSYDQVTKDLAKISADAETQAKSFSSGAVSYYNKSIVPEVSAAQADVDRQEKAGRDKISFSAAQFHSGGRIGDFGDLWTSPSTGFIHAQLGEHVLTPTQLTGLAWGNTHSISGINAGSGMGPAGDALASERQAFRNKHINDPGIYGALAAKIPASGASPVSVTIQAWDGASVDRWLRTGGAQKIQAAVNQNTGRYSGVALG